MSMKAHVCGLCDMPFPYQCEACNLGSAVGIAAMKPVEPPSVVDQASQAIKRIFIGSGEDVCLMMEN